MREFQREMVDGFGMEWKTSFAAGYKWQDKYKSMRVLERRVLFWRPWVSIFWWMSLAGVTDLQVMHVLKRDTSFADSIVFYVVKRS